MSLHLPYQEWNVVGTIELVDPETHPKICVRVNLVKSMDADGKFYAVYGEMHSGIDVREGGNHSEAFRLGYGVALERMAARRAVWDAEQAKAKLIAPDGGKKK